MKYRLAVFDLDGTILNTLDDLADSLNHVLSEYSYPARTTNETRQFVGNGIYKLIERAVPQYASADDINKVYTAFGEYYKLHCTEKTAPYNGIPELLQSLRNAGIKTAVVSNKADFAVKILCDKYFPQMFDSVIGERKGTAKKPAPDSVNKTLENLCIPASEAVYIGDSDVDILTAKNAGVDCISVSWGFRSKQFLCENGAKTIVSDAEELKKLLI